MYWFIFCGENLALTVDNCVPQSADCPVPAEPWTRTIALPAEVEATAVRIDAPFLPEGLHWKPLRATFDLLTEAFYRLAGKARELIYWDETTRFCGVCGAPAKFHTEISKRCTVCGKEVWPALQTAIIVRITRGEEILLVQSRKFKRDYYGLVAGFVETGETLEDCVHREVREETGLEITPPVYFASQPWPYPSGLMVGFTAAYAGGELRLQREELRKGGWFTRTNLPEIPGRVSLARRLIDDWLEQNPNNTAI